MKQKKVVEDNMNPLTKERYNNMEIKKSTMIDKLQQFLNGDNLSISDLMIKDVKLYLYFERSWNNLINLKLEYQTRLCASDDDSYRVIMLLGKSGKGKTSLGTYNIPLHRIYTLDLTSGSSQFFDNYDFTKHDRFLINEWNYPGVKDKHGTFNNLFENHNDFIANIKYGSKKILCKQYIFCTQNTIPEALQVDEFIESIIRRCTHIFYVKKLECLSYIDQQLNQGKNIEAIAVNEIYDITNAAKFYSNNLKNNCKKHFQGLNEEEISKQNWMFEFNFNLMINLGNQYNNKEKMQVKVILNDDLKKIFHEPEPFKFKSREEYDEIINSHLRLKNPKTIEQKLRKDVEVQVKRNSEGLIKENDFHRMYQDRYGVEYKPGNNINPYNITKSKESKFYNPNNLTIENPKKKIKENKEEIKLTNIQKAIDISEDEIEQNTKKLTSIYKSNHQISIDKSSKYLESIFAKLEIQCYCEIEENYMIFTFKNNLLQPTNIQKVYLGDTYGCKDLLYIMNRYTLKNKEKIDRIRTIIEYKSLTPKEIENQFTDTTIITNNNINPNYTLTKYDLNYDNLYIYIKYNIVTFTNNDLLDLTNIMYTINKNTINEIRSYYEDKYNENRNVKLIKSRESFLPIPFISNNAYIDAVYTSAIIEFLRKVNRELHYKEDVEIVDYLNPIIYDENINLHIVFELFLEHSALWLFYPKRKTIYIIDSIFEDTRIGALLNYIKRKVAAYNQQLNIQLDYSIFDRHIYNQDMSQNNCLPLTLHHALNILYEKEISNENYLAYKFRLNINEENIRYQYLSLLILALKNQSLSLKEGLEPTLISKEGLESTLISKEELELINKEIENDKMEKILLNDDTIFLFDLENNEYNELELIQKDLYDQSEFFYRSKLSLYDIRDKRNKVLMVEYDRFYNLNNITEEVKYNDIYDQILKIDDRKSKEYPYLAYIFNKIKDILVSQVDIHRTNLIRTIKYIEIQIERKYIHLKYPYYFNDIKSWSPFYKLLALHDGYVGKMPALGNILAIRRTNRGGLFKKNRFQLRPYLFFKIYQTICKYKTLRFAPDMIEYKQKETRTPIEKLKIYSKLINNEMNSSIVTRSNIESYINRENPKFNNSFDQNTTINAEKSLEINFTKDKNIDEIDEIFDNNEILESIHNEEFDFNKTVVITDENILNNSLNRTKEIKELEKTSNALIEYRSTPTREKKKRVIKMIRKQNDIAKALNKKESQKKKKIKKDKVSEYITDTLNRETEQEIPKIDMKKSFKDEIIEKFKKNKNTFATFYNNISTSFTNSINRKQDTETELVETIVETIEENIKEPVPERTLKEGDITNYILDENEIIIDKTHIEDNLKRKRPREDNLDLNNQNEKIYKSINREDLNKNIEKPNNTENIEIYHQGEKIYQSINRDDTNLFDIDNFNLGISYDKYFNEFSFDNGDYNLENGFNNFDTSLIDEDFLTQINSTNLNEGLYNYIINLKFEINIPVGYNSSIRYSFDELNELKCNSIKKNTYINNILDERKDFLNIGKALQNDIATLEITENYTQYTYLYLKNKIISDFDISEANFDIIERNMNTSIGSFDITLFKLDIENIDISIRDIPKRKEEKYIKKMNNLNVDDIMTFLIIYIYPHISFRNMYMYEKSYIELNIMNNTENIVEEFFYKPYRDIYKREFVYHNANIFFEKKRMNPSNKKIKARAYNKMKYVLIDKKVVSLQKLSNINSCLDNIYGVYLPLIIYKKLYPDNNNYIKIGTMYYCTFQSTYLCEVVANYDYKCSYLTNCISTIAYPNILISEDKINSKIVLRHQSNEDIINEKNFFIKHYIKSTDTVDEYKYFYISLIITKKIEKGEEIICQPPCKYTLGLDKKINRTFRNT